MGRAGIVARTALVVALVLLCVVLSASAQDVLDYRCLMMQRDGHALRLWSNGTTHAGHSGRSDVTAMAWDARHNTFYTWDGASASLYTLDAQTQESKLVRRFSGVSAKGPTVTAMGMWKNQLYAVSRAPPMLIRLTQPFDANLWERVANLDDVSIDALAIDTHQGLLYAISNQHKHLIVLDLRADGKEHRSVPLTAVKGAHWQAMSFLSPTTLLAYTPTPIPSLYTISRVNGHAAFFRALPSDVTNVQGLVCYFSQLQEGSASTASRRSTQGARLPRNPRSVVRSIYDDTDDVIRSYDLGHLDGLKWDNGFVELVPAVVGSSGALEPGEGHSVYFDAVKASVVASSEAAFAVEGFAEAAGSLCGVDESGALLSDVGVTGAEHELEADSVFTMGSPTGEARVVFWATPDSRLQGTTLERRLRLVTQYHADRTNGGNCSPRVDGVYPSALWTSGSRVLLSGRGFGSVADQLSISLIGVYSAQTVPCVDVRILVTDSLVSCFARLDGSGQVGDLDLVMGVHSVSVAHADANGSPADNADVVVAWDASCALSCNNETEYANPKCERCFCRAGSGCSPATAAAASSSTLTSLVASFLEDMTIGQLSSDESFLAVAETYKNQDSVLQGMPVTRYVIPNAELDLRMGIADVEPLRVNPYTKDLLSHDSDLLAALALSVEAESAQWTDRRDEDTDEVVRRLEFT